MPDAGDVMCRAARCLWVHKSYSCELWPDQLRPAAVIHNPPALPQGNWLTFAKELSSGRRNTTGCDVRFGNGLPSLCRVELVTGRWGYATAYAQTVPFVVSCGERALVACRAAFQRGADLVLVLDAKKTFPSWSVRRAGHEVLRRCFGSGNVFDHDELFGRIVNRTCGSTRVDGGTDAERDAADWWKSGRR